MEKEKISKIIESLESLKEDQMTVKRVKDKADEIISLLKDNPESNVDKALRGLEELDDADIPSYDRTLIWDIISMLESLTS